MTMQGDSKLEEFLDELCLMPETAVDYVNAPRTTAADWTDAEVLLPVTRSEFAEIQNFIAARRLAESGCVNDASRSFRKN